MSLEISIAFRVLIVFAGYRDQLLELKKRDNNRVWARFTSVNGNKNIPERLFEWRML